MNWDKIEGNWKELKGRVHEKWGKLTVNDLEVIRGNRQKLSGMVQKKYGLGKEEAEEQIHEFEKDFDARV